MEAVADALITLALWVFLKVDGALLSILPQTEPWPNSDKRPEGSKPMTGALIRGIFKSSLVKNGFGLMPQGKLQPQI